MKVKLIKLSLVLLFVSVFLGGCSSLQRLEKALFKESTLNNLNPAPEKMSPPDRTTGAKIIDPVHNRTLADYHYTMGEALSMDGQSQKAIEEFKLTLIYDPNSATVHLRLAAEFIKQGLMSEAIEQAELAIEVEPSSLDGRLLLGGLYSTLRMYDVAMKQYDYLAIQYPDNLEIPIYRGALLAEQKRYPEAEQAFLNLAKSPKNKEPAKAYHYLGRVQFQQDSKESKEKGIQSMVKAVSLAPENEEYVMALAKMYEENDQKKLAFSILSSFQDKFGPKRSVARSLSVMYLENEQYAKALKELEIVESYEPENLNIKVKIALILIEQKEYDQAIDKLEEIIRVAPESDKIRFYLGAVYEEVKNHKLAYEHFSKILPGSAYYSEAVVHAAYLQKLLGNTPEAIKVIEVAIAERDDVPQFYTFYASLLDDIKSYDKAVRMLEKAVVKFPDHAQIRFFLGSMWDRKGNKTRSVEEMKKVLDIDENHVQALNFLAYTYAEIGGDLEAAEMMAFRALDQNPDDGYILDTVGWIMYKKGNYKDAIKYLEAAHKNVSQESIIAEHLGDAYFRYDLIDKARKMYLKAVAIAEDETRIREIRTKLSTIENQKDLRRPASSRNK